MQQMTPVYQETVKYLQRSLSRQADSESEQSYAIEMPKVEEDSASSFQEQRPRPPERWGRGRWWLHQAKSLIMLLLFMTVGFVIVKGQIQRQLPPEPRLARFDLDEDSAPSCHGNQATSLPCRRDRRLLMSGISIGPLRAKAKAEAEAAGLSLTSNRTEIVVNHRDGVVAVQARVRVRLNITDEAVVSVSGGVTVNNLIQHPCDDAAVGVPGQWVTLQCTVTSFVSLRAGDRVSFQLRLLHQSCAELLTSSFINIARL